MIVTLILLGRYLEARAKGRTVAGHPPAGRPAADARPASTADGSVVEVPHCRGAGRRRDRRAPGRARAGRRRGDGGRQLGRRKHDHRRAGPRRQGRRGDASSAARSTSTGALRLSGDRGRRGHDAGADRPDGRGGPGRQAAHPGVGRPRHAWFVPAVMAAGGADLRRLADLRPRPGADLRAGQCRGGADHRLPLRHGPGDAHVSIMVGHRARCRTGRAVPQGRGAAGAARRAGRRTRQDRHADRRPAGADRPDRWPRASTGPRCWPGCRGRGQIGASDCPRPSCAAQRPRGCALPAVSEALPRKPGSASVPGGRGRRCRSARTASWPVSGSTSVPFAQRGTSASGADGKITALRRHRRAAGRDDRRGRPDKPSTPAAIRALARSGPDGGHDHRRQRAAPPRRSPASSASTRSWPRFCRPARSRRSSDCAADHGRSPSSATASTMPRRWPRPTSASPSARAPTSRSRRPTWC